MIPLIINDGELEKLKQHGHDHFVDLAEMRRMANGQAASIGDRNGYSINLEVGYRVVFSIEEHPRQKDSDETVWLRHVSMNQVKPGRAPSHMAMKLVGEPLGFPVDIKSGTLDYTQCQVWLEDECVNVACECEIGAGPT